MDHNRGCPIPNASMASDNWIKDRLALARPSCQSGDGQFHPFSLLSLETISAPVVHQLKITLSAQEIILFYLRCLAPPLPNRKMFLDDLKEFSLMSPLKGMSTFDGITGPVLCLLTNLRSQGPLLKGSPSCLGSTNS